MSRGRIESLIYQASNWTVNAVGTATAVATVTASSTRYPSDLATAFGTALSTATTDTVTVTISAGESGTGLCTISSSANIAITWTSTDLRDLLGFTGNLSAATSHVGTKNVRGLWLPNAEAAFTYGNDDAGHTETDMGVTESPRGDIKGLVYTSRTVLPQALWSHVPKAFARIAAETTVGASFEQWWRWTQGGELTYFYPLSQVRLYSDASTSTHKTYRIASHRGTEMPRVVEEWNGLFRIELNRLIRVPGT
jgi:hypothetical protein